MTLHHICYNSLRTKVACVALSSMIRLWELHVLDWGNMHLIMLANRPYSCTLKRLIHRELAAGERAVMRQAFPENECMSCRVCLWVSLTGLFFEQKYNFYNIYIYKVKPRQYVKLSCTIFIYSLAKQNFCRLQQKIWLVKSKRLRSICFLNPFFPPHKQKLY